MKLIKAGLLLALLLASSLVAVATVVLKPEQWALVMLGLFLVGIQAASTKRVSQHLGLGTGFVIQWDEK